MKRTWLYLQIFVIVFFSCGTDRQTYDNGINIKSELLDSLFQLHGNRLAILSCLRCNCYEDYLNQRFSKNQSREPHYLILTDTSCGEIKFPVVHLSRDIQEEISDEFYNIVFIKKEKGELRLKILKASNVSEFSKIEEWFFQ